MDTIKMSWAVAAMMALAAPVWSQEQSLDNVQDKAQETLESARETAAEVAEVLDESEQAQEVSAGILKPIYQLAEMFAFPAFYWIAFTVMVAGVVSFALQLTLGKLVVLSRLSFSLAEILSDALGLAVSLVGLVLTTQAAAENSSFASSAASVLSATAVGALAGFVFYLWGQRQELEAVEGRRKAAAARRRGKKE
jgi:ABC-type multidrug transport system fused ATPase/permease subunit